MESSRRDQLEEIARDLIRFVRIPKGFSPRPMFFDEGVIAYLDRIVPDPPSSVDDTESNRE